VIGSAAAAFAWGQRARGDPRREGRARLIHAVGGALWAVTTGWTAYVLYALGWLPGATKLQAAGMSWTAGAVSLIGGLLSLAWSGRQKRGPEGHQ
ncbi:MAG: hypothetical protein ACP5UQ_15195, partial [Anaerolineae bacterium]